MKAAMLPPEMQYRASSLAASMPLVTVEQPSACAQESGSPTALTAQAIQN